MEFDTNDEQTVVFMLYRNIGNMKQIKELLMKNQLKAAVINPTLIYHVDQLLFAAHKSLFYAKNQQMKTKTLFTELLYSLFPSKSIRDALTTFGSNEHHADAIFAIFNDSTKEVAQGVSNLVEGELCPIEKIPEITNIESVRKLYKIPASVTDQQAILNCILTKLASKDLIL